MIGTVLRAVTAALAAAVALGGCTHVAESEPASLDRAFAAAVAESGAPGATAAVIEDGEVVWTGAEGTRRSNGRGGEMTPATPFITASSGKTVTAAMVLRLVDQGRIGLGDRVSSYLPGLVGARRITVEDLLRHTSGLPDYLNSRRLNRIINRRPRYRWRRGQILRTVRRLEFRPGSRHSYSNTNYVALGGIVERATGERIQPAFMELVGEPLGLERSSWHYGSIPAADFARPHFEARSGRLYGSWPGDFVPTDYWGEVWTDGGLATTAAELGTVANELIVGDLLTDRTRAEMLTIGGRGFGLGVFEARVGGERWIGHDGLYGGFSSQHWTNPRTGATIAVLANLEAGPARPDASWLIFKRLASAVVPPGAR